jgi:N-acetylneuraminate synthase/sialic acid synthase
VTRLNNTETGKVISMHRELILDLKRINDTSDCYVIAEIGHNHQGDIEKAKEMFKVAAECGADAVKLQKRDNRTLYTASMYNKPYDHENSFGKTYGEHREFLEFGRDEYLELQQYAKELGVTFFATAFDAPSAHFLEEINVPAYKIASGDHKNIPLIKQVAQFQKPMIVSLGGATIEDAQRIYDVVMPINPQLCLLHCTATYPTEPEEMNLRVISTLQERFPGIVIGLSDHSNGIAMAVVAYALGARVIEKHFTLNHTWKGTDHALSLEPIGLRKMSRDLKRARIALGDGVKIVYPSEASAMQKMGKALVAAQDLPAGHRLSIQDIAIKSPGDGLSPIELDAIIGKTLKKPLQTDEAISFNHLVEEK